MTSKWARPGWDYKGGKSRYIRTIAGMDVYAGQEPYRGPYSEAHEGQKFFAVVYATNRNFVIFKDGTMVRANGDVPDDVPISIIAYARLHL